MAADVLWRDAPLSVRLLKNSTVLIEDLEPWQQPEVLFDVLHYFGQVYLLLPFVLNYMSDSFGFLQFAGRQGVLL